MDLTTNHKESKNPLKKKSNEKSKSRTLNQGFIQPEDSTQNIKKGDRFLHYGKGFKERIKALSARGQLDAYKQESLD